jgi:hypothetical protein
MVRGSLDCFPFYPCMLQVSSFSSCTFSRTQIPNLVPWMTSMVHKIYIDCYCAPKKLLSNELCPVEVSWCKNYTLNYFNCTFLIRALFCARNSTLEKSLRVILFKMQRLVIPNYHDF